MQSTAVPASGFRPDIQGLRAIAVLAVVAYHAALALPGGFAGVDMFFVISGFVITSLLLREWNTTQARQDVVVAAQHAGVVTVDRAWVQCPDGVCEPLLDGQSMYRDEGHLSVAASEALAPAFLAALSDA